MNNEQSLAANEKTDFVLAVRMFTQEFLPQGFLFRMIRVHADDVVGLETAFSDEPVDFSLVGRDDRFVVGVVREIAVSLLSLKLNTGGPQFSTNYVNIFGREKWDLAIRFRIYS